MPPKKRKSSGTSSDKAVGAALRALPASGPLPDDTRSLLYGITRPCNGQSRCRDPDKNPSCLCALRPLIGTANSASRRKRGELWRFADADAVKTLGSNTVCCWSQQQGAGAVSRAGSARARTSHRGFCSRLRRSNGDLAWG